MKKITLIFSFLLWMTMSVAVQAARVDSLQVRSNKMNRAIPVLVTIPADLRPHEQLPVVYMLHGYTGDEKSWLIIQPKLKEWADRDRVMIVTPDGENSWYWDSPLHADSQFETFVSQELIAYIDSNYPTRANRLSRAITGLSMGGHGAMWLAIRHKDIFGAVGSTSGGVDIRLFPEKWEMNIQLGEYNQNKSRWDAHTVMTQLDKIANEDLAIIFDCGSSDFFYKANCKLHEELLVRGIYHDFIARPGKHNLVYWNNSIEYQWLFFKKFFEGYRTKINGKLPLEG